MLGEGEAGGGEALLPCDYDQAVGGRWECSRQGGRALYNGEMQAGCAALWDAVALVSDLHEFAHHASPTRHSLPPHPPHTPPALPWPPAAQVRVLLRQREADWKEVETPSAASPVVALPHKGAGSEEAEDWRAVLDRKAVAAGAAAAVQDSARGSPPHEAEEAAAAAVAGEAQQAAAAPEPQLSAEEQKQQAVQALVATAPAAAPWDVPALVQAVQGQSALDLSAPADAETLAGALLDHAAASAAAASGSSGGELEPLRSLPPAIVGCAALLAELAGQAPAVGEAAAAQLVAAFKKRSEARSREARAQLGHQMLLAGSLAQRGVLPEAQLQTMLEQLARQVGCGWECLGCGEGEPLLCMCSCWIVISSQRAGRQAVL